MRAALQSLMLISLLLAAMSPSWLLPARGAEITIVYKSCPGASNLDDEATRNRKNCSSLTAKVAVGRLAVGLSGPIAPGDTRRLRELLDRHIATVQAFGYDGSGTFATVFMSGEGGDFDEAIRLGGFFKQAFVHTRIAKGTRCSGACALAFMGGTALWGRLERPATERRLEAGGKLAFVSPFKLALSATARGNSADALAGVQDVAAKLNAYAVKVQIPSVLLTKILQLDTAQLFAIDSVFWAKIADVTVEGILPPKQPTDEHYISACYAQVNWNYGFRDDFSEPPRLRHDNGEWIDAEILHRAEPFMIVSVVVSFGQYDFWCAINSSKETVRLKRAQIREILEKQKGRNTLLDRNYDEDIVLSPNSLYFSKSPNDRADSRAENGLDLLLHPPQTKLDAISNPKFERDLWYYPIN